MGADEAVDGADRLMLSGGLLWVNGGPETDDHLGFDPHEASLEPTLRELLGHGVFLDVGAHIGRWSLRLSGQAKHVWSVECNPETLAALRHNIKVNGLKTKVTVLDVAAWDSRTFLNMEDPNGKRRGGSNRVLAWETAPERPMGIPAAPLDDFLAEARGITLVKLDVEGADLHALRGMRETLKRERPVLFIERHDHLGYYKIGEMYSLLWALGYDHEPAPSYMAAEYLICRPVT